MSTTKASSSPPDPEIYYASPTPHCPNSHLPILVYRNVLPPNPTETNVRAALEKNSWLSGGTFKHYPTAHFHSNTHELYAALRGRTVCLYGVGPLDLDDGDEGIGSDGKGVRFEMEAGDVAVHAAGVAHRNLRSSADYQYMGFYPEGAPHWNNNFCKAGPEETKAKAEEARVIPLPRCDPIYGLDGPLPRIWASA